MDTIPMRILIGVFNKDASRWIMQTGLREYVRKYDYIHKLK